LSPSHGSCLDLITTEVPKYLKFDVLNEVQQSLFIVLRANPVGTRQGKIVLAQYQGPSDPDAGGAFTIKKYSSEKGVDEDSEWRHTRIVLSPLNPEHKPIIIPDEDAGRFLVLADSVLEHPQQVVEEMEGLKAYQSKVDFGTGRMYLLRTIVDEGIDPAAVVTVHRTSKIAKYRRES
jgi:hypothetical protein